MQPRGNLNELESKERKKEGRKDGRKDRRNEGWKEGWKEGRMEGRMEGRKEWSNREILINDWGIKKIWLNTSHCIFLYMHYTEIGKEVCALGCRKSKGV